jgi:hypothetical protein
MTMTRTPYRTFVALGLVLALLAYVGCSSRSGSPGPAPGPSSSAAPTPKPSGNAKLFANWPDPAAAIMISGEQDGYLEPCGCAQGQMGGLLRRYDLVDRTRRQRKWPLALIDVGSLIKDPAGARGGPEQSKIKFGIALKALATMKYDALALSAEDLKLGAFEALGEYESYLDEKTKVVAANVTVPGFESRVVRSVRVNVGSVPIGITAVIDPEALKKLNDPGKDELLKVKPIDEVLAGVLADLEKDTRVQVLMVQGPAELARTLAESNPGFDVVVGSSRLDPPEDAETANDGKTVLVNPGAKGKYVIVVGVFPDQKETLRYQRLTLGNNYDGPAEPMKQVIQVEFRDMLKAAKVVENFPRHAYVGGAPGSTFVGAETCRSCHPNTFAKWKSTKHAHAFEALLDDPKPNTQYDVECVSCHTTGFEYDSGWRSAEATPQLKGNQCENCHGPASKHVAEPDNAEYRRAIALTAEGVQKNHFCVRCHDEDNSPKFEFPNYYGQIAHKGLDRYDDPKVHKGRAVESAGPQAKSPGREAPSISR